MEGLDSDFQIRITRLSGAYEYTSFIPSISAMPISAMLEPSEYLVSESKPKLMHLAS